MIVTPAEAAIGRSVIDALVRSIKFFYKRASFKDAGGARTVDSIGMSNEGLTEALAQLTSSVPKAQSAALADYFESPEFAAVLRQVLAARILYGPQFGHEARKSLATLGAGLRIHIPHPAPKVRDALNILMDQLAASVNDAVNQKSSTLLKYASDPAFQLFLQEQLKSNELVVRSLTHSGEARDIQDWLDRYQAAATKLYSRVRTPHWNDQVLAPIDRIYVPANFRFLDELAKEDTRLVEAYDHWLQQLNRRLRNQYGEGNIEARVAARMQAEAQRDRLSVSYDALPLDRLVVLGDPGAGKTTLGMRLAHDLLSGRGLGSDPELHNRIPFVVTLREYAKRDETSFAEHISDMCASRFQCRPPANVIEFVLALGRALVIFDGLDELPDTSRRSSITQSIEAFAAAFPNVRILVTSRLVGYVQAPLDKDQFTAMRIMPFSRDDVAQYAQTWFLMDQGLDVDVRASTAKSFLRTTKSIEDLRSNPLLLALLCNLYRATGYQDLPRNRPAILEKCALVLFDRWDRNRGIGNVRFEEDFAPTIAHLAFIMFTDSRYAIGVTEGELRRIAVGYLWPSTFSTEREAELFCNSLIEHCRDRAWVFTDVGTDPLGEARYQFTHRTFLEYFAAAHVVRRHKVSERIVPVLLPPILSGEWGLVPLLVLQILSRLFDDDADAAVNLMLDTQPADEIASQNLLLFLFEVLGAISLRTPTISRIVHRAADHATMPSSRSSTFTDVDRVYKSSARVSSENRSAFETALSDVGWAI